MPADYPTPERLREVLHYEPETGVFTRRIGGKGRGNTIGAIAGTLSSYGYRQICVDGTIRLAHQFAWLYMYGVWPAQQIDHRNHIRTDNRISNLRLVTPTEQQQNCSLYSNNKSGHHGVYWGEKRKKWCAQIATKGRQNYLGSFDTKEEAITARKAAEITHGFHPNHGLKP